MAAPTLSTTSCTSAEAADEAAATAHRRLKATFASGRTRSYAWRVKQLQGIERFVTENEGAINEALTADLGRPQFEITIGEVAAVIMEVRFAIDNLKAWMKPEAVPHSLLQKPGHSLVIREPKGVILCISPWNFPICLPMHCISAAFAAGNCCLLKPSEVAGHVERLMCEVLPRYLDSEAFAVMAGGVVDTTALLKLRWDHIVYTGNATVGRIVARAAAEHLTPITLELGGKSPTVVLPDANLAVAAKRILAGKFMNAGQICIAPDYIIAHKSIEDALVKELQTTLRAWYGEDARKSASFGRIINHQHFNRLKGLIETSGGEVLPQQGMLDEATKFIPPTLVRAPDPSAPLMQQEIFGPVLPIVKAGSLDEIIDYINAGDKPLVMYIFGRAGGAQVKELLQRTSAGGVLVNDTLFHFANLSLPFGGVGESGIGRYHGKWGFTELSHLKGVMYRGTWVDLPQRYPPYTAQNLAILQRILLGPVVTPTMKKVCICLCILVLFATLGGWLMLNPHHLQDQRILMIMLVPLIAAVGFLIAALWFLYSSRVGRHERVMPIHHSVVPIHSEPAIWKVKATSPVATPPLLLEVL